MSEEKQAVNPLFLSPDGGHSVVRENLLTEKGYSPYCGNDKCFYRWPRTSFNGEQFTCKCGWKSAFDETFITAYKTTWGLK